MRSLCGFGIAVVSFFLSLASVAEAAAERKDLEVVARSVGFLTEKPRGEVMVGVVADPAVMQSLEEAKSIEALIDSGIRGPAFSFRAISIFTNQLADLQDIDMLLVTKGLSEHHQSIFEAASRLGILTVSTDESCVDSGHCVMWVKGSPSVRIVVNRAAARASNISFQTSFRMLITER
ncbi:MAG: YfiR/HmsC family protein [Geminicoccaceae bacterium]